MNNWVRRWLGLEQDFATLARMIADNADKLKVIEKNINRTVVTSQAVGRLVARLDPNYAKTELDNPERKAESDRLGEEVIAKLEAEDRARRHTLGEF